MTARRRAPSRSRIRRSAIVAAAVASLLALMWWAGDLAFHQVGRPFPSVVFDPFGSYSAVYLPSWGAPTEPGEASFRPRFPDCVVALDGARLDPPRGLYPSELVARRVAEFVKLGHADVALTFEHAGVERTVVLPLRRFVADDVVFLFVLYAVAALLVLWSGVMVVVLSGRRPAAYAYGGWSLAAATFLLTFFDYHTSVRLVPLFSLSVPCIAIGFLGLAWSFPDPPRSRRFEALAIAVGVALALLGLWLAFAPAAGLDPRMARLVAGYVAPASGFVLVVALALRWRRADVSGRRELRAALWGIAAVPVIAAIGLVLPSVNGVGWIHLLAPFLVPLIPLSIGYALIRHNLLATKSVLTKRMLIVPIALVSGLGAILVWLVWRGAASLLGAATGAPLAAAGVAFVVLCWVGRRVAMRWVFSSAAEFRPSIEQLSDALSSAHDEVSIRRAIERVVTRWLPNRAVKVLDVHAVPSLSHLPAGYGAVLDTGGYVWTDEDPWSRSLLVPARSKGELRGVLHVSPSDDRGLFTSEDIALLETIASLGAVALHNVEVLERLDGLRRLQVGATKDEKLLALGTVGAELSHEIMGPLSFFRFLLQRLEGASPLDEEDVSTGKAEVGRLERMLNNLRKLHAPAIVVEDVALHATVQRAIRLLGADRAADGPPEVRPRVINDVEPATVLRADADALLQVIFNLVRNGVEAAGPDGTTRVATSVRGDGVLEVEVSDTGPGVAPEIEKSLFNPWVTTKSTGTGLGLAITLRIVRSLGWTIDYRRREGRTCFVVTILDEVVQPAHRAD